MDDTQSNDMTPVLHGEWRVKLAADAGCEVSAIATLLQREWHSIDPDLVRGLTIRLEHLSGVALSCLTDVHADEAEVFELLHGPEARRQRAQAARQ